MIETSLIEYYGQHWYKIVEGEKVLGVFPSVTTKLGILRKEFLETWRGDLGNREAEMRIFEAQQRGKRVHHAWHCLCTGGAVAYQPYGNPIHSSDVMIELNVKYKGNVVVIEQQDEMWHVYKLQKWLQEIKPEILHCEKTIYSLLNREAGTLDNVFKIKEGDYMVNGAKPLHIPGSIYIVDLKTGNSIGNEARYQTAAYSYMAHEMGLLKSIFSTLILHTGSKNQKGIEGLSTLVRSSMEVGEDYRAYRHASSLWEIEHKDEQPKVWTFPSLITMFN